MDKEAIRKLVIALILVGVMVVVTVVPVLASGPATVACQPKPALMVSST